MRREEYLAHLANKHGWKIGAEIGVWYGNTFFYLMDNVPGLTLYGVDIWKPGDKFIHHADQKANRDYVVQRAHDCDGRTIILEMPSVEAAKVVTADSLDFVFIDADHSFAAVCEDITAWLPKVKVGGFVLGHDWDWATVREAVKKILPDALPGSADNDYVWEWVKQ